MKTFRSNKRLIQSQFFQRNGHTRHLPTYTHATYIPLNHSLSLSFSLTHLLKPQNALTSPYLKHIRSYSLFKWAKHGLCFLFFVLFNNNFNRRLTGIRTRIVGVKGEHADPFTTTTANRSLSLSLFQRNDHDSPHSSKKKFCDQSEHSMLFVFLFVNTFAEVGSEPTTIWQLRLTATSSSPRPEELLNKIKLLSDVPFESINTIYPSKSASDNPFAPWNDLNIFCKHSDFN